VCSERVTLAFSIWNVPGRDGAYMVWILAFSFPFRWMSDEERYEDAIVLLVWIRDNSLSRSIQ
jgi:hypothetical protein